MDTNYTPLTPPPKKTSKSWILPVSLIAFVFCVIVLIVIVIASLGASPSSERPHRAGEEYLAVLYIEGTIASEQTVDLFSASTATYDQEYVLSTIEYCKNDEDNRGLILYIDSPGGELYAVDEVYLALQAYKAETGRPIYAYCASYCCSGGYYLACTAEQIYANRMGLTGSIGVTCGYHLDLTGLCEKLGIDVTLLASDEMKAAGGYFSSGEQTLEEYQPQIDEYYNAFVDVVDAGRPNLAREQILPLADGRTYTAKQALANGLIDGIGSFDDLVYTMLQEENLDEGMTVLHYRYVYSMPDGLLSAFLKTYGDGTSLTAEQLLAYLALTPPSTKPMVYYYGN